MEFCRVIGVLRDSASDCWMVATSRGSSEDSVKVSSNRGFSGIGVRSWLSPDSRRRVCSWSVAEAKRSMAESQRAELLSTAACSARSWMAWNLSVF